jgi:hypothetical protein
LSVLGLGALVVALALALRTVEVPRARAAAIVGVLAIGSLHHLYTVVATANVHQTVLLQLVTAVAAGALLWSGGTADSG